MKHLTQEEINLTLDDVDGNIFIYATFLKPGRHQIIIKDQINGVFWAKNIVVDPRRCEIKQPEYKKNQIKKKEVG